MRLTRKDVARRAGLSPTAVSLVFSGKHRGQISAASRRKIIKAARELGYRPHVVARSLAMAKTFSIAVAMYHLEYLGQYSFGKYVSGVAQALSELDYGLQFCTTAPDGGAIHFLRRAQERGVDGFIISDAALPAQELAELHRLGTPAVLLNRRIDEAPIPAVIMDERRATRELVERLLALGHGRFLFSLGTIEHFHQAEMRLGAADAMEAAGLKFSEDLVEVHTGGDPTFVGVTFAAIASDRFLARFVESDRPTAVVCGLDQVAVDVVTLLERIGLHVPEDVSVASVEMDPMGRKFRPPIAAYDVRFEEAGALAAGTLLRILRGEEAPAVQWVEPVYAEGESIGPAPCG